MSNNPTFWYHIWQVSSCPPTRVPLIDYPKIDFNPEVVDAPKGKPLVLVYLGLVLKVEPCHQPLWRCQNYELITLGLDSPFCSTMVLFQNRPFSLGFWRFLERFPG